MEESSNLREGRTFYAIAGISALLIICIIIIDIAASIFAGKAPTPGSLSASDVFAMFQTNPFRAFQYMGMANILEQVLMLLIVYAFYVSHKNLYKNASFLTLLVFLLSLGIYLSNNASLPLYALSTKYTAAGAQAKQLFAAAGEAVLSKGEDFTAGSLLYFLINEVGVFMMLIIMVKSKVFGLLSSIVGLVGVLLLTVFTWGATLSPALYNTLMTTSMVGGLLMLTWYLLIAIKLFRLSRNR
jgi:hypothetical protein